MIIAVFFVESFPLPALSQICDNFAADSSLNASLWTNQSSILSALAIDTSSPANTFLTPTLSFSSAGMQMTGVNGHYQFAGIQSLAAFAPPFTLSTTVMGTLSPGNAFAVFLVNGSLSQWLAINGDLIPDTCYQNIWINYTGSGIPLSSLGNALYGNPSLGVFYTIQISVGTNGNASVALMTNGVTLVSQSGLSVGNGPFYVVLAQKEGWPCDSGPLAATWQSICVTSVNTPSINLVSPTDGALNVSIPPTLNVAVSDPDNNRLTVTFYGQVKSANAGPDFTIIALPDTQYYSHFYPWIFTNQTEWIVNNRVASNIVYVTQLGDCVDDGDSNSTEWYNATNALYRLESVGIPYGVAVGNHDEDNGQGHSPLANPTSDTTILYNQFFGTNHFSKYKYPGGYYGGNYGTNGDNFYELFSASGMDFIVLYFEYDEAMTSTDARLTWGNNLLQAYANRRAIVVSHYIITNYTAGSTFGAQGQAIYDALKTNANLFLMLCGHICPDGEGRRTDVFNGSTVWTLLSDYQDLGTTCGNDCQHACGNDCGDGWLRIYTFSPSNNVIHAQTYSPYLSAVIGVQTNMTDANNQFDIPYNMSGMWVPIATNSNVASGSTTSAAWPGLTPGTQYQWYVTVSDGQATTTGPVWTFTVKTNVPPVFLSVTLTGGMISFDWSAIPGRTYQLQYKTNLAQIDWISLGGTNTATDVTMSATDSIWPDPQRFYRVILLP